MSKKRSDLPTEEEYDASQQSSPLVYPESRLKFKEVRKLTLDVQSIGRLGAATIKCESDLYTIQMPDLTNPGYKRAMSVVDCWDTDRDERYTLICNAVMESTFQRYTEGVNGRYFHLESGEVGNGKRYRKVDIIELEVVD